MSHAPDKTLIIIDGFNIGGKRGGTRTYIESLSTFLKSQGFTILNIPKSQNVKNSYSSLFRIKLDSMRMKIPPSIVAMAQRPDDLLMFKLFKRKNKSICVLHGDNLRKMKLKRSKPVATIYKIMEKQGLYLADRIICVDQSTFDIYVKRYPWLKSKSVVIPVGVNTSIFKPLDRTECRRSLGIPEDSHVMLVAGRLEKEKNIGAAIQMVKEHLDDENSILLIAGTGQEEATLKELAKGIKKAKIQFLGQVPYPELPKIINASDVILIPSLFESGPLVIIEAMACGVPSVSTDVGRARIFIGNSGCGAVVKNVEKEFAEQAKKFLNHNPSIKENCTERVKLFSFHNTGEETLKLIRELE
ncbi:MAG: glycosyltransferase family 4 protein [Euryarchaeota archaeon]|nr:glycosyltransferase family 4 protein [Euryarchaeota archaeon]